MKIYFVRHGESECNLTWEFSNREQVHGLTEKGVSQAYDLADKFDRQNSWRIFSSPILRAKQTAQIVADTLGAKVELADPLREYDVGVLEGRSDKGSWQIYYDVVDAWMSNGDHDARIEGGESFNDIRSRFLPFIHQLASEEACDAICIGHGGTFKLMLPLVTANLEPDFGIRHGMDHTTVVVMETKGTDLFAVRWGDLSLDDV